MRLDEALTNYKEALNIFRKLKDPTNIGQIMGIIGNVQICLGHLKEAIDICEEALAIFRDLMDNQNEGRTLYSLGVVHYLKGEREKAVSLWLEALTKLIPLSSEFHDVLYRLISRNSL